jgi:predicted oxidoreductase
VPWETHQVHRPDPTVDVEETLSALSDLIDSGKVRAIGASTLPASEIVEAEWVAERRGLERFRTEQPPYSIVNRSIEREVLPICRRYGMGTLVWSPLGQGLLAGRYRKGKQMDSHRSGGMPQHFRDERKLEVVEQLIPLADEAGLQMTHLAMAFAIAHPGVTSAIIPAGRRALRRLNPALGHRKRPRARLRGMRMRGLAGRWHRLFRIARLRPSACVGADGIGLPGRMNVTTNVATHGPGNSQRLRKGRRREPALP